MCICPLWQLIRRLLAEQNLPLNYVERAFQFPPLTKKFKIILLYHGYSANLFIFLPAGRIIPIIKEVKKMNVSRKEVEYVASLARLDLTPEEKEKIFQQFNVILDYINRLKELNLAGVEPTTHVLQLKNVFRKDRSQEKGGELLAEVLKEAPDKA